MSYFDNYFKKINECVSASKNNAELFDISFDMIKSVKEKHKKIIIVGNGGSAAIASHVAVDFTKVAKVRAINFNEADLITCFANDYGYEHWVEMALEAYADSGDLVVLISSSGRSLNMINAAAKAKKMGASVITLSGFANDNPLRELGDINFWADSSDYNVVEVTHQIWLLALVDKFLLKKSSNE